MSYEDSEREKLEMRDFMFDSDQFIDVNALE